MSYELTEREQRDLLEGRRPRPDRPRTPPRGITPTGNEQIDTATAELALELRMAHPSMREQSLYDEAMRIRDAIMAGTRELPEPLPAWRPAVNGTGRAPWFLYRGWGEEAERVPLDERYYLKGNGKLCRFTTRENAQKVADKLNAAEGVRA